MEGTVEARSRGGGDGLLLLLLAILAVVLGRVQSGAAKEGRLDPVSFAVRRAIGLLSGPFDAGFNGASDLSQRLREGDRLARENEALRMRLGALALYSERIERLDAQVANLRTLSGLGPLPGHERIMADVVGFQQYEGRIDLSVGTERGVDKDMPVVCADGLVGIVQTAWVGGCQVALVTNVGIQVGGLDLSRKPPTEGLVKGRDPSTLVLTFFDPNAAVMSGDTVVTSGHSSRIPRGILIGRVVSTENDSDYGIRRAILVPFVNPGTLKEVQVLK